MRGLAILAFVAIVLMFLGGWLYYHDSGSTSEIILDKQKVEQDAQQAIEKGKEAAKKAGEEISELGKDIKESVTDKSVEDEPTPIGP